MGVVAEAARELDELVPGWYRLIDTEKLNLDDSCHCVLGQIAKKKRWRGRVGQTPYIRALYKLGLYTDVIGYAHEGSLFEATAGGYPRAPWLAAIRNRLAKDPS